MINRKAGWILLAVAFGFSLLSIILPFLWISPFRPQTSALLQRGFEFRRAAPVITLVCALTTILLTGFLWKDARRFSRIVSALLIVMVGLATWFSRQNYFEWFFHPVAHPGYVSAQSADFLNDSDMVLAVEINGDAVAYPVRLLAYHHLVNDTVGGIPIVATY